jgi:predicted transcriptional regulator of viral defense system
MQTSVFIETLRKNNISVFRLNDAAKILRKPRRYVALFLHRAVERGFIKRAEKGLYYPVRGTNEYIIASAMLSPSYVSMISALHYYGLTTQIPNTVYVVSPERHRPVHDILGHEIIFKHIKREMMFGYRRETNSNIMIADPEKALIDIFYFNDVNDIDPDVLETPPRISVERLISYAIKSNNLKIIKKTADLLADYNYLRQVKKLKNAGKRLEYDR